MALLKLMIFGILLGVGLYYLRIYIKGYNCQLTTRIDDRMVLITGANSGIGLELAKELARRGGIIHMTCRDSNKCSEAKSEVLKTTKVESNRIFTHSLDLGDFQSILNFSKEFKHQVSKLDIQINNAGVMNCPYMQTKDGFELQIGVNYIGHFLLTNELLELVLNGDNSRIINVASSAHLFGSINRTDINLTLQDYGEMKAYAQSKLANILHAKYLAEKLKSKKVAVVSLHPGAIVTNLQRYWPTWLQTFFGMFEYFMKSTVDGIQTQLCLSVDPDLLNLTGNYFEECSVKESYNSEVKDDKLAEWLWQHTEEIVQATLNKI